MTKVKTLGRYAELHIRVSRKLGRVSNAAGLDIDHMTATLIFFDLYKREYARTDIESVAVHTSISETNAEVQAKDLCLRFGISPPRKRRFINEQKWIEV